MSLYLLYCYISLFVGSLLYRGETEIRESFSSRANDDIYICID